MKLRQKQEKKSTKINNQIAPNKTDLIQQHTEIMKKQQDMLADERKYTSKMSIKLKTNTKCMSIK